MSSTQQALFVKEIGKPMVLGTREIPSPKEGQVLIKVHAAQLLPHDTYGRDTGLFFGEHLPYILGTNIAGTITALGPNVTTYSVGDQIFGLGFPLAPSPDETGLQQYAILKTINVAKLPPGFSFDQIVTFPVNATTSYAALFSEKGFGFPTPSDSPQKSLSTEAILVIGGGSSVGKLAIQLAKMAGVGQILAVASSSGAEELLSIGATHIIDRHLSPSEITSQINKILGEDNLTKIYDCVSWDYTFPLSLLSHTNPSVLLTLHPADDAEKLVKEQGRQNIRVQFILGTSDFLQPLTEGFWKQLPGWVESGKLRVGGFRVIEGLEKTDEIENALDAYRDGSKVTPVVVHP
ncbi:hypothetical protein EG329_000960 [Mollisiaceae sp. DMI_Dod_QoI]|nr:hypothetical protein EG329_000960 [Helotiales sp. DMI_Dod_QoI]